MRTINATVLNGLPIQIEYQVEDAEPDVGLPRYLSHMRVLTKDGKPAHWIEDKLTAEEYEQLAYLVWAQEG